jgi:transposase
MSQAVSTTRAPHKKATHKTKGCLWEVSKQARNLAAVLLISNAHTIKAIADICDMSMGTVGRIKSNLLTYGSPYNAQREKAGSKPKISPEMLTSLLAFLEKHPKAYLDEMVSYLSENHKVDINQTTIWRVLKGSGYDRKALPKRVGRGKDKVARKPRTRKVVPAGSAESSTTSQQPLPVPDVE